MAILSTGKEMRKFDTGAVRDSVEGKGRCDLLPHAVLGNILDDNFLRCVGEYVYTGDQQYIEVAIDLFVQKSFPDWNTALLEVAKHYEEGSNKYEDRNFEKGMPLHCFVDSGIRHYLKFLRGDKDESHDRAVLWNLLNLLWMQKHHPEMNDLPFANKTILN